MTILIEVRSGSGQLEGRYDASCYNAKHEICICVCGGMNHGQGIHQAIANNREMFEAATECYNHTEKQLIWGNMNGQLCLPGIV